MSKDVVKLKAEIMWAELNKLNDLSGKYQVNLCQLSDAAVKALEDVGISVLEKDGYGKYITCKSVTPIKAVDTDGNEITDLIGNGSKAKAAVVPYEWVHKNKKGISPSLSDLVITDLIVYQKGVDLSNDEEVL